NLGLLAGHQVSDYDGTGFDFVWSEDEREGNTFPAGVSKLAGKFLRTKEDFAIYSRFSQDGGRGQRFSLPRCIENRHQDRGHRRAYLGGSHVELVDNVDQALQPERNTNGRRFWRPELADQTGVASTSTEAADLPLVHKN